MRTSCCVGRAIAPMMIDPHALSDSQRSVKRMDGNSPRTPRRPRAPRSSLRREVIRRAKLGRKWEKRGARCRNDAAIAPENFHRCRQHPVEYRHTDSRENSTDLPDGQISDLRVQSRLQACPVLITKIFRLTRRANHSYRFACPARKRGVGHRHERWAGCGGRCRALRTNGAKADGEVVWS